jgi:hypothetical protein
LIYLIGAIVGMVVSVTSLLVLGKIWPKYRNSAVSEMGIKVFAPLPFTIAAMAYAAGVYLVLRLLN